MSHIVISYTPAFTSSPGSSSPFICHRICYRLAGVGLYCCVNDNTASFAGVPKSYSIDLNASPNPCAGIPAPDPQTCSSVVYEGYIQACCEPVGSLIGQVPFTATFVPNPLCIDKLVCCQAQRSLSSYNSLTWTPGAGYSTLLSPLTVTVVRDPLDPVPSGGSNDAVVHATLFGGIVTGITIVSGGLYGKTPLLVIPSPTFGDTLVQAFAIITILCSDNAYVGNCTDLSPGDVTKMNLLLGGCANFCLPQDHSFVYNSNVLAGLPDLTDYNYLNVGCCSCDTCRNYTVTTLTAGGITNTICYTTCTTLGGPAQQHCVVTGNTTITLNCIVPGSIYCSSDSRSIVSIIDIGACGLCV